VIDVVRQANGPDGIEVAKSDGGQIELHIITAPPRLLLLLLWRGGVMTSM